MKKSRFTDEQMVAILRAVDRGAVAEVARKHKVSEQTLYTLRKKFGKLQPTDVKRMREFEVENNKLKRMLAEREMAIERWSLPAPGMRADWSVQNCIRAHVREGRT